MSPHNRPATTIMRPFYCKIMCQCHLDEVNQVLIDYSKWYKLSAMELLKLKIMRVLRSNKTRKEVLLPASSVRSCTQSIYSTKARYAHEVVTESNR